MKIAYHAPTLHTIYAQRTIYEGYKYAFEALGHQFSTFTAGMDLRAFLETERPDLFLTQSHFFHRKQLDYEVLAQHRRQGMTLVTKVDFWNPLDTALSRTDSISLRDDKTVRDLMERDLLGDEFTHVVEQDDERMAGFADAIGRPWHTIPLAADERLLTVEEQPVVRPIVYLGTYLPAKKQTFQERLFPLRDDGLTLIGQDWTRRERIIGKAQRAGQYFNVPVLRSLQKPARGIADEGTLYATSAVSVNLHEWHQRSFGGDCNERTFKIPAAGGFQVVDDVSCIRRYFGDDEIVIASTTAEWFDRIRHFLNHPEERSVLIEAGRKRVAGEHTYSHRASALLKLAR